MTLKEALADFEDIITWDGFDDAFIGVVYRCATEPIACYDAEKMREILCANGEMTYDEACEYLEFNVFGAFVGEKTPFHLDRISLED